MPDLLLVSPHEVFFEDMAKQIELEAPEFKVLAQTDTPDAAILDESPERLAGLRERYPNIPIFVLMKNGSEKNPSEPPVRFFTKPLQLNLFLNCLRSAINLSAVTQAGRLRFNGYELNPLHKEICHLSSGRIIKLTEKEIAVIQYLYKIRDRIVTKNELLREVWEYHPEATTHTIETHIYRLRQKVEEDTTSEPFILTEDGGYVLQRNLKENDDE